MPHIQYEEDDKAFPAHAYRVDRYNGIACYVRGWEVEPDEDTEWTGYNVRTGRVVVQMVGDDRLFAVDPETVHALEREEYCGSCGQMGCTHDGLDRD